MKTRSSTRRSLGLPVKRRSKDEIDDIRPPPRPRKKAKAPRKPKFPLMKLPAEIRLKILEQLLVCKHGPLRITGPAHCSHSSHDSNPRDPVHHTSLYYPKRKTLDLHPAVLCVSKQLYQEGRQILYGQNSFDVKLWYDDYCDFYDDEDDYGARSRFMRCGWDMLNFVEAMTIPLSLRVFVQRLHLTISISAYDDEFDIRRVIRAFIRRLPLLRGVKSLVIHLEKDDDSDDDDDDDDDDGENWYIEWANNLFRPFGLVRGLEKVSFTGIVPSQASELVSLMTSQKSVVDLPRMFRALRTYVRSIVGGPEHDWDIEEALHRAESAMDRDCATDFMEWRQEVIDIVDDLLETRRQDMFRHDPEVIRTSVSENTSATGITTGDNILATGISTIDNTLSTGISASENTLATGL
jgi:hypothetical protein